MLNEQARREAQAFLENLAQNRPDALRQYEEWLRHPVTRQLSSQLEILREGDVIDPGQDPGPYAGVLALATAGARARVWEAVHFLMFNLPTYATRAAPAKEADVESRPNFL